ncbi:DUF6397 family protein [Streptomyces sp. NRRL F-5630]|uniref:DUF6397 family protein n=1 Tax=Streptomyces sp. NRRL F-5630 TaxID=1463864 RepID=UPI000A9869BB
MAVRGRTTAMTRTSGGGGSGRGDLLNPEQAASLLELMPDEVERAAVLDVLPSVPGRGALPRRFTVGEIERQRAAPGFPRALREAVRCVGTADAAALLGIAPHRFTRLAKLGLLAPVEFHFNRYRAVVWAYLATEVEELGRRRSDLLVGRLPVALRSMAEGDRRAARWRERRRGCLYRLSSDPWERAALLAVQLGPEETARAADPDECGYLRRLVPAPGAPALTSLKSAQGSDELAAVRAQFLAELLRARADRPAPRAGRGVRAGAETALRRASEGVSSSPPGPPATPSATKNSSAPALRPTPFVEQAPPGPAAPRSLPGHSASQAEPASLQLPDPCCAPPPPADRTLPPSEPADSRPQPPTVPAPASAQPGRADPPVAGRRTGPSPWVSAASEPGAPYSGGSGAAWLPGPAAPGVASLPLPAGAVCAGPESVAPSPTDAPSTGASSTVRHPLRYRKPGVPPTAPLPSRTRGVSGEPWPADPPGAARRTAPAPGPPSRVRETPPGPPSQVRETPPGPLPSQIPQAPASGGPAPAAPIPSSPPGGPTHSGHTCPSCPPPRADSPSGRLPREVGQERGGPPLTVPVPATPPPSAASTPSHSAAGTVGRSPVTSLPGQSPLPFPHRCCPHACASAPPSTPPACCPALRGENGIGAGERRARRRFVPWSRRQGGAPYQECRRTGTGAGRCR